MLQKALKVGSPGGDTAVASDKLQLQTIFKP